MGKSVNNVTVKYLLKKISNKYLTSNEY